MNSFFVNIENMQILLFLVFALKHFVKFLFFILAEIFQIIKLNIQDINMYNIFYRIDYRD